MLACAGTASAQPASGADTLFEDGRKALEAGHPAEACAKFEQAYALDHDAMGVMLNLGLCNEQLDKLASAAEWFARARTRASELHLADSETAAKDQLAALVARVATVAIEVRARPSELVGVTVDDKPVAQGDLARVPVDAGHHVIVATSGNTTERAEVDVRDGDHKTVPLVFPATELAKNPTTPPAQPVKQIAEPAATATAVDGATQKRRAYIVGAAGGVLVTGSVVLGLVSESKVNETDHPDTRRNWQDVARYGGTSLFVIGAAGMASAVWMYLHAPEQSVVPVVGRDSIGVSFGGSF